MLHCGKLWKMQLLTKPWTRSKDLNRLAKFQKAYLVYISASHCFPYVQLFVLNWDIWMKASQGLWTALSWGAQRKGNSEDLLVAQKMCVWSFRFRYPLMGIFWNRLMGCTKRTIFSFSYFSIWDRSFRQAFKKQVSKIFLDDRIETAGAYDLCAQMQRLRKWRVSPVPYWGQTQCT